MSSTAAAPAGGDLVLSALPPIKTAVSPLASTSKSATSTAPPPSDEGMPVRKEGEVEEVEPTTPTSEENRLRAPTECPPAPRKPPARTTAVKRKTPSSSSPTRLVFFPVQRDLSAVFRSLPPKKRIRAG